jgi:hypothetical protein
MSSFFDQKSKKRGIEIAAISIMGKRRDYGPPFLIEEREK